MGWGKHEAITQLRPKHEVTRHVPHLWGVRYNRWYFWDGRADSLWSQALIPIEDVAEMASSRVQIAQLVIKDKSLRKAYQDLFGPIPKALLQITLPNRGRPVADTESQPDNQSWDSLTKTSKEAINHLFANIGKSIASFEETIVSLHSPFDQFTDQLLNDKPPKRYVISASARQGLKLFIGKAACISCHFGPNFSDGEFHHPFLSELSLKGDLGRYEGITKVLQNPFNANSQFHDADKEKSRNKLDYVYKNIEFRAQFKTPSLRNVATTYPYMHTGEFQTLEEVLDYYNTISERMDPNNHQEVLLKSLDLTTSEQNNLIEFLKTLTDESATAEIL